MSLQLSISDCLILQKYRLERLRSLFGDNLKRCQLQLDQHHSLIIHCPEPWMIDQLIDGIYELRWYSWVIVSAYSVVLCFAGEEVYRAATCKPQRKPECCSSPVGQE